MTQQEIKQGVEDYKNIIKEAEKGIASLQQKCNHPNVTQMPYYWAPGHYGGECKVCNDCNNVEHIENDFFITNTFITNTANNDTTRNT